MSILVSRIIGNHIPGRYSEDAVMDAFEITMDECDPEGGQWLWILNRLFRPRAEAALLGMLGLRDQWAERLPFVEDDYRQATDKSHYLTNVNAARNFGVDAAKAAECEFCLPLDSRCIFTEEDWVEISATVNQAIQEKIPYVVVPQVRIQLGEEWDADFSVGRGAFTEPAVALSVDAPLLFDEDRRFGDADKAELLAAIGYPGPWREWAKSRRRVKGSMYGKCFLVSDGLIRVLPSGNDRADRNINERARIRAGGIQRMVEQCNLSVFGPQVVN